VKEKMNYPNNQLSAYESTSIQTASGTKLVVMLYEGAIKFLNRAADDIRKRDLVSKGQSVNRALKIIQHLRATLDTQKGKDMAQELDALYGYTLARVLEGSTRLNVAAIEEAIKVLSTLLPAWEEIAKKEQEQSIPAGILANQAVSGGFRAHI
jgi:flagellar protein FliS